MGNSVDDSNGPVCPNHVEFGGDELEAHPLALSQATTTTTPSSRHCTAPQKYDRNGVLVASTGQRESS